MHMNYFTCWDGVKWTCFICECVAYEWDKDAGITSNELWYGRMVLTDITEDEKGSAFMTTI